MIPRSSLIPVFVFFAQMFSVVCIDFSFTSFTRDPRIVLSGGTTISAGSLQLPGGQPSSAAFFDFPVQLWHRRTTETASFSTYFEFLVSFPSRGAAASGSSSGGFAFFLAPAEDFDPRRPGSLSLSNGTASSKRLLAVEFDLFRDNSSSVNASSSTAAAANNGSLAAQVSYNATSKVLQVSVWNLQIISNSTTLNLPRSVDMRRVLPDQVLVGFSATNRSAVVLQSITRWNFTSDLEPEGPKKFTFEIWMVAPIAGFVLALLVAASIYYLWKGTGSFRLKILYCFLFALEKIRSLVCGIGKGRGKGELGTTLGESTIDDEFFSTGTGPRKFSYRELAAATNNFSDKQMLGEGGFGGVYKGFLNQSGREVAVKKISSKSKQGKKEYASEVKIISRLRHRNLVQLLGWCHERGEFLLVYEFLPNGSLDAHLFDKKASLPWRIRFSIALGLAKALLYLHEEWEQCVVHRDIKSSNVMLDSAFDAKLGDFGLARLVDHQHGGQHATRPAGTLGYLAPECFHTGKASKESDVYSFGVVALEIATGRRAVEHEAAAEEEVRLVEWVWELYGRGRLLDAADHNLGGDYDREEMERVMLVGLWSAHPDHLQRPSVREAIQAFTFQAAIPSLPKQMPVPVFEPPPPPQHSNSSTPTVTFGSLTAGR